MKPIDAFRCARMLLDQHGQDASLHAAQRADELQNVGDDAGRRAWMAILAAVDELGRTAKTSVERLH